MPVCLIEWHSVRGCADSVSPFSIDFFTFASRRLVLLRLF